MNMFHTFFLAASVCQCYVSGKRSKERPWISISIQAFFFHFFLVEPLMNDTMEGRFPFCHNRNPAATQVLSKRVASKHNGSRFAVSLLLIQTIFDCKSSTWSHLWVFDVILNFFFSFLWVCWCVFFFFCPMATHPKSNNAVSFESTQYYSIVSPFANCTSTIWELSLLWKATGDVLLTAAAELGFKWPSELHRAHPLYHSSLWGSALRQVHVCLFSTCHDIAWLHPPPHHHPLL